MARCYLSLTLLPDTLFERCEVKWVVLSVLYRDGNADAACKGFEEVHRRGNEALRVADHPNVSSR